MGFNNKPECPDCRHAPILHEPDGLGGAVCIVCVFLAQQVEDPHRRNAFKVCIRKFRFMLSRREREQAVKADRDSWQRNVCCINCGFEWQQHTGYLCPTGDSTFLPFIEGHNENPTRN